MWRNFSILFFYLAFLLFFIACKPVSYQQVKLKNITPVDAIRLDQAILHQDFNQLIDHFGTDFEAYLTQITPFESLEEAQVNWHLFVKDSLFQLIQKEINSIYPTLTQENKQLAEAFAYLQHYFPMLKIPKIYAVNSGFNYGSHWEDDVLWLGLDVYLGKKNPATLQSNYPLYLRNVMEANYLVPDAITHFIFNIFYPQAQSTDEGHFAETIIYFGKMMYLLDCALPYLEDHLKMKYTTEQWLWATEQEKIIWEHILHNNLLYSNEGRRIHSWIQLAPFTSELGNESPDRLGIFIGWKIVRTYMQANLNVQPSELLTKRYQDILPYYQP